MKLSETALGYSKLSELLQDGVQSGTGNHDLMIVNICRVLFELLSPCGFGAKDEHVQHVCQLQRESKGYFLVPVGVRRLRGVMA
eukprot:2627996-Amphidinium_carterae.1